MNDLPPQTPKTKDGLGVASLVLGVLSMVACSIFSGIPAVITGHMALSRVKRAPAVFGGKGFAIAGLITGYLSLAILPLLFLFVRFALAALTPELLKANQGTQASLCANNLKQVVLSARMYANEHKDHWPPSIAAMSNELVTPNILVCPSDQSKIMAADWSSLGSENISYTYQCANMDDTRAATKPVPAFTCPIDGNVAMSDGSVKLGNIKGGRKKR